MLALAPVRGQLPFEALRDLVERSVDVAPDTLGTERLAAGGVRDVDAMPSVDPRVLLDHLDLDPCGTAVQPFELRELVLRGAPELVRHAKTAGLQDEVHPLSPTSSDLAGPRLPHGPARRRANRDPPWLTWSLAPHPPAEGVTAERAV